MNCRTVKKNLDAFRTGELPVATLVAIGSHLDGCCACSEDLARLKAFGAQAGKPAPAAPDGLADRVLERTLDRYGPVETVLGALWVGYTAKGIALIVPGGSDQEFEKAYRARVGRRPRRAEVPAKYSRAVAEAAAGRGAVRASVDLSFVTDFHRKVLRLLPTIPRGEVRPYSWLAREAGRPRAVRAAATAVARNPAPFVIPCHRVVPLAGGVGNYAFGSPMKRRLLAEEGAPLDELESLARAGVRFVGSRTTKIYCFPSCRDARRIAERHRVEFADETAASREGYRPCLHCRPPAEMARSA